MLEDHLAERMKMRLVLPESDYVENRLKALAWLIGTGQLEIKVVLPTDARPPAARSPDPTATTTPRRACSPTPKATRSASRAASTSPPRRWRTTTSRSWSSTPGSRPPHLGNIRHKFDRLWEGKEKDWIALPIPEAVKQELLKFRPATAPTVEFPDGRSRR